MYLSIQLYLFCQVLCVWNCFQIRQLVSQLDHVRYCWYQPYGKLDKQTFWSKMKVCIFFKPLRHTTLMFFVPPPPNVYNGTFCGFCQNLFLFVIIWMMGCNNLVNVLNSKRLPFLQCVFTHARSRCCNLFNERQTMQLHYRQNWSKGHALEFRCCV